MQLDFDTHLTAWKAENGLANITGVTGGSASCKWMCRITFPDLQVWRRSVTDHLSISGAGKARQGKARQGKAMSMCVLSTSCMM